MGFETGVVRLKVGVRLSGGKHYGGRVRAGLRLWWVILAFTVQLRERRGNISQGSQTVPDRHDSVCRHGHLWWVILAFTVQLRETAVRAVKQCQIGTIQSVNMATFAGSRTRFRSRSACSVDARSA